MDTMDGRVRPGAVVECSDGRLGTVESVEPAGADGRGLIRVKRGWTGRSILVPSELIREVDDDGTIRMACSTDDLARVVDTAAGEASALAYERTERIDAPETERTLELRAEELVPHKEMREVGAAELRKVVEEVPGRLEVEAQAEEVVVERRPIGQVVTERAEPWTEDDGTLVVPVYEEQLVLVKRLVLKEQVRVRREVTTERRLFEDTLRRERLVVEDPDGTGLVRERYATEESEDQARNEETSRGGGLLEKVIWKALH